MERSHPGVVVSLTTTSARIDRVAAVVRSLEAQTLGLDRLVVWVSRDPYLFDAGVRDDEVPSDLRALSDDGIVELRWTPNLGPHRKYLPLLQELIPLASPPLVVTADDDTLYPSRWLETLVDGWSESGAATCFRARRLRLEADGAYSSYSEWPTIEPRSEVLGHHVVALGKDGVLFHPHAVDPRILSPRVSELSTTRSDIWLAGALRSAGTPMLKLSIARVFPDATGVEPLPTGEFPAPNVGSTSTRGRWDELWTFNHRHSDNYVEPTFQFFAGAADVASRTSGPRHGGLAAGPTISIVVAAADADPNELRGTLTSADRQSYRAHEIVVVDPSAALDPGLLEGLDVPVRIVRSPGPGRDWERAGTAAATGEYVAFLDVGDLVTPFHLESLVASCSDVDRPTIVIGPHAVARPDGRAARSFLPVALDGSRRLHLVEAPGGRRFGVPRNVLLPRSAYLDAVGVDPDRGENEWIAILLRLMAEHRVVVSTELTHRTHRSNPDRDHVPPDVAALVGGSGDLDERSVRALLQVAAGDTLLAHHRRGAALRQFLFAASASTASWALIGRRVSNTAGARFGSLRRAVGR